MNSRSLRVVGFFLLLSIMFGQPRTLPAQKDKDREVLLAAYRRGEILRKLGKTAAAIQAYEKAVSLADRVFGSHDASTSSLLNNLASLYQDLAQYAKAEPLYQRSLKIDEDRLGKDHPAVASSLNNLATLYQDQGKYDKAEPLFLRSLKIWESKPSENLLNVAACLNNLAFLYQAQAQHAKAEPLYQRSLKIRRDKLGNEHPMVATVLNNLAEMYRMQGRYGKAEAFQRQSLRIREAKLPKNHSHVGQSLNNLALLYHEQGQFAKAEPLYQRGLRIREAGLGEDHPDVAASLNNLAGLYRNQGQYAKAQAFYLRSLKIYEAKLEKYHLNVATSLNNLAALYAVQGKFDMAGPLYQRSLKIRQIKLGEDHPVVATSLNNLAELYRVRNQFGKAVRLYQQSLKINEDKLGKDHPDVATSLNNLARLYQDKGQYNKAEALYLRSLKIVETNLPKGHPTVAIMLENLAVLSGAMQHWQDAAKFFDRARRGTREHVYRVLPALTPQEQLLFLHRKVDASSFGPLSLALQQPEKAGLAKLAAGWLINGKALTQEAMAESLVLSRAGEHPELAELLSQLLDARKQLANLTLAIPRAGQVIQHLARLQALTREEEKLTRALGQKSGHILDKPSCVELDAVRRSLPADAVFVDIARFPVFNFQAKGAEKKWQPARYVAWVIPPQNKGKVELIDLGSADKIDALVAALRQGLQKPPSRRAGAEVEAEKELSKPSQDLAKLVLKPLLPHIAKRQRWIISPDASLWLVPWGALPLPDGSYAVEKYTISHVISGRDLVVHEANATRLAKVKVSRPLVLADPDFDLQPSRTKGVSPSVRGLLTGEKLPRFTRLPGTAAEAKAIAPLLERFGNDKPVVLTGKDALEKTFKAARSPRILVVSTHGFFLEDQTDVVPPSSSDIASRGLKLVTIDLHRPKGKTVKPLENPLLRCGLALAGANLRDKIPDGADDGILTGLEIVGTDLRGTELVVLSACETGLGKVNVGEGVAGLRQAFQLAGAQSVLATLWQIPDRETTALMTAFFENLAAKKGKAESLRLAQLQIIKQRRAKGNAAHPFYWAAFTLTGVTRK